jgi:predicted RNA-binding protein with PIN domain
VSSAESGVDEGGPSALPEAVRARVAVLAAQALGQLAVEHLPPALKKVAAFAPARRARLAGNQIVAVLDTDEEFRERLAVQVEALVPDLAAALSSGGSTGPDPVGAAAAAYLLRPPGWKALVAALNSVAAEQTGRAGSGDRVDGEVADRVRRRLEAAEEELRELRRRHKEEVQRLKAENAEVRRKLGDARVRLREADDERATLRSEVEEATAAAERRQADAAAELRRLRGRLGELEQQLGAVRRSERAGKATENLRTRLLVDALVDTALGLRRELGLPALDRLPADTVAADRAEEGTRVSSGRGSLPVEDPALLEELLRLPRAHLVVDGYNVTKTAWPDLSLERQRERLLVGVAALRSRTGAEVTVVFDAGESAHRPPVAVPRGVRVLFSPFGVIADDVIRDLVAAEPVGRAVVVVSSDQEVARDVVKSGFRVVASPALHPLLTR